MATLAEIQNQQAEVEALIMKQVNEDPKVGMKDWLKKRIEIVKNVTLKRTPEALALAFKALDEEEQKKIIDEGAEHNEAYEEAVDELEVNGSHLKLTQLPKKLMNSLVKGALIGMGIEMATTVGSYGVVSGIGSFVVGAELIGEDKMLQIAGTAFGALFEGRREVSFSSLAMGAVTGAISYTAGRAVAPAIKMLKEKLRESTPKLGMELAEI